MFIVKIKLVLEAPQIWPVYSLFSASHMLSSMPAPFCTCPCQPLLPPYVCNLYLSHHPSCHFKIKPHFLFNSKLSWLKSLPNEVCYEICLFPDIPSQGSQGITARPPASVPLATYLLSPTRSSDTRSRLDSATMGQGHSSVLWLGEVLVPLRVSLEH